MRSARLLGRALGATGATSSAAAAGNSALQQAGTLASIEPLAPWLHCRLHSALPAAQEPRASSGASHSDEQRGAAAAVSAGFEQQHQQPAAQEQQQQQQQQQQQPVWRSQQQQPQAHAPYRPEQQRGNQAEGEQAAAGTAPEGSRPLKHRRLPASEQGRVDAGRQLVQRRLPSGAQQRRRDMPFVKWWQRGPRKAGEVKPVKLIPTLLHWTDSCKEVLDLVLRYEGELDSREMTVAFQRMGALFLTDLGATPDRVVAPENAKEHCARLFSEAQAQLGTLDTQGLATAVWMCARFHYLPPAEERAAWERALWERRFDVTLIEVSNIIFSLGVLHWLPTEMPALNDELLERALQQAHKLTPWMVCNIMWGCARLQPDGWAPSADCLVRLVEASLPQLDSFSPESFCAMLFSLACLRMRPDDAALTAVLDAFQWQVPKSNNRQLVTVVWSLGALQITPLITESLWDDIERQLLQQADEFNFSSAPFFLFGSARLQLNPSEPLLRLLLAKTIEFLPDLRTGDVTVVLWALCRMGHKAGEGVVTHQFLQPLVERFMQHNAERPATLRQLSTLLWATSQLKAELPPATLAALIADADARATEQRRAMSTTDATMLLNAFETMESPEGLAFLKRHIMGRWGARHRSRLFDDEEGEEGSEGSASDSDGEGPEETLKGGGISKGGAEEGASASAGEGLLDDELELRPVL